MGGGGGKFNQRVLTCFLIKLRKAFFDRYLRGGVKKGRGEEFPFCLAGNVSSWLYHFCFCLPILILPLKCILGGSRVAISSLGTVFYLLGKFDKKNLLETISICFINSRDRKISGAGSAPEERYFGP